MSSVFPAELNNLIDQFARLPGVGPKSASRMAYHYLRGGTQQALDLADALRDVAQNVSHCSKCYNVSTQDVCDLCASHKRDGLKLCIVEEPLDVVAFEDAGIYNGYYFVLGGVISPADGVHPEELRFAELKERINEMLEESASSSNGDDTDKVNSKDTQTANQPLEIIIATNPSLEGETTAEYIRKLLSSLEDENLIKISRIAMGLPNGVDLEYADRLTLKRALEGRR